MFRQMRWVAHAFGWILAIIGLAGVPDDLSTWASWLRQVDANLARWALVIVGICLSVGSAFSPRIRAKLGQSTNKTSLPAKRPDRLNDSIGGHPAPRTLEEFPDSATYQPADINSHRWRTTYEFRRDPKHGPGVTLRLTNTAGEEFAYFRCRVTNPLGEQAEAPPKLEGLIPQPKREATVHYPGQFRGIVLMPPGEYVVEWYGITGLRPDSGRILLNKIAFTVHEGRIIR